MPIAVHLDHANKEEELMAALELEEVGGRGLEGMGWDGVWRSERDCLRGAGV